MGGLSKRQGIDIGRCAAFINDGPNAAAGGRECANLAVCFPDANINVGKGWLSRPVSVQLPDSLLDENRKSFCLELKHWPAEKDRRKQVRGAQVE